MTKLNSPIKREIQLRNVPDAPINLVIRPEGIEMSVRGFKTKLFGQWESIVASLSTPPNVPSFVMGHPVLFLQEQAKKFVIKEATHVKATVT